MYYIIYKTINKINGKFYIGKHISKTLEFDGYFGSGQLLKSAIKKYGTDNFDRETLFIFDNILDMNSKERSILTAQFLSENKLRCYNLREGGNGGGKVINIDGIPTIVSAMTERGKESLSSKMKNTATYRYEDGTNKRLNKDHPDVLSGIVVIPKSEHSLYYVDGVQYRLRIDDPSVLTGEAISIHKDKCYHNDGFNQNRALFKLEDGSIKLLNKTDGRDLGLKFMNGGTSVYRYEDGTNKRLNKDHPDVLSGIAVGVNAGRKFENVICPHCNKIGSGSNMTRYHFDNCKFK